jgi:hypothetical protein
MLKQAASLALDTHETPADREVSRVKRETLKPGTKCASQTTRRGQPV